MTAPLRIAMSSFYLPSESKIGAGYQAHLLAQAMVDRGHQVTMFSPCARPEDARYHHQLVDVPGPLRTFRWSIALRRVNFDSYDVFHAAGDDYLFFGKRRPAHIRTLYGSCFAEAIHIRGSKERARMFLLGLGEVAATVAADESVCISTGTRKWFPWVRTVIPCGVDPEVFRPGGLKEHRPTILFVGTHGRRKRGWLLMEAFQKVVLPNLPDAQLWMVCSDAPAATNVEVLGRLDEAELAERYRRAWVFCLPSSYEGFGVPYIEALASGLPVVATPNAGAREVLRSGEVGVIVEPEGLGAALLSLLENEQRRDEFARLGVAESEVFRWSSVAERYQSVYRDAAECRRGS